MSVADPNQPPPVTVPQTTHPVAIWYFFWGEFAERCSYYGMRAILPLYLTTQLKLPDETANEWYAAFKMACYLLPLLGGYLADRFLGRYWTIVGFSVPYVIGQLLIGIPEQWTVVAALSLCAMGSGVIKPNISALLGQTYDQQRPGKSDLRGQAFLWFYFSINIGAFISLLALPIVRDKYGYQLAFLIPAAFMAVALAVFALGKKKYATETVGPATPKTPAEKAEQWQTLIRLFGVFGLMVFFWVVYEHNDTQWTFFARDHINRSLPGWAGAVLGQPRLAPDQFQFVNALCVLLLIVFFQWFWRLVDPSGKRFPPTTKILIGFVFTASGPAIMAAAAYSAAASAPAITAAADAATPSAVGDAAALAAVVAPAPVVGTAAETAAEEQKVSMWWIVVAYFFLTLGEVLLYGTMLDLSYAYAPARMKGLVTACFLLTNTLGNLVNSQYGKFYFSKLGDGESLARTTGLGMEVTKADGSTAFRFSPEVFFSLDAAIALLAAAAFFFVARRFNRGPGPATT